MLITLFLLLYILYYIQKRYFIKNSIASIGVFTTYLHSGLILVLFCLISWAGYLNKGNLAAVNYSYELQQQEQQKYLQQLQQIAAQQITTQNYKAAENSYRILLNSGLQQSNIYVGYVIAQLAQNMQNSQQQTALLLRAIKLNPFDNYAQLLLKHIMEIHG